MKQKTIYLASDNMDEDFNEIAFESESEVIKFCRGENKKDGDWGWHEIIYYYS